MKINEKSWHYRFAMLFRDSGIDTNLCAYTRAFMLACLSTALIGATGLGLVVSAGDMLGWLAAMGASLCWIEPTPVAGLAIGLLIVIAGLCAVMAFLEVEAFAPIREAARARKEMFCPSVEFER